MTDKLKGGKIALWIEHTDKLTYDDHDTLVNFCNAVVNYSLLAGCSIKEAIIVVAALVKEKK